MSRFLYGASLRRFPYFLIWRETYPKTFSPEFLSICEYNSPPPQKKKTNLHVTDLWKTGILYRFVRREWWTINMGKTAKETYIQTIIICEFLLNALQINQKIIPFRPFHRAIDETLKIAEKCWPFMYQNFNRLLQFSFVSLGWSLLYVYK